ncbi:ARV1 (YLR242C) [Zygosaccharomyces parabailii]|nr:ARV1 (YLR242C) [Zygosaccharomyces parabailii]
MICIECAKPVDSLYTIYSNKHIQLTDCPKCHKVVDHYVEFDNVLLFIDLLLLKPGAYRHLIYNSLDYKLSSNSDSHLKCSEHITLTWLPTLFYRFRNWLIKYDKLNRVWLLLIAFEIYLTWVIEERSYAMNSGFLESADSTRINPVLRKVFAWDPLHQYLYFAFYCLLDISIFHSLTRHCIVSWSKWGQEVQNAKDVLSYAILLSYGAKIFPILMLIWPYDTVFSMNIIKCVANLYIVESLKIVTNLPYRWILQVFAFVLLVRWAIVKAATALLVAGGDWKLLKTFFQSI